MQYTACMPPPARPVLTRRAALRVDMAGCGVQPGRLQRLSTRSHSVARVFFCASRGAAGAVATHALPTHAPLTPPPRPMCMHVLCLHSRPSTHRANAVLQPAQLCGACCVVQRCRIERGPRRHGGRPPNMRACSRASSRASSKACMRMRPSRMHACADVSVRSCAHVVWSASLAVEQALGSSYDPSQCKMRRFLQHNSLRLLRDLMTVSFSPKPAPWPGLPSPAPPSLLPFALPFHTDMHTRARAHTHTHTHTHTYVLMHLCT
jgi:hypothetical protein